MSVIIPAVLVPSRKALDETLARLDGLVDTVQIDIVDGIYVGPPTWPYTEASELSLLKAGEAFPALQRFKCEVDLMVQHPEKTVGAWIDAGASRVLLHIETVRDLAGVVSELQKTYGHEKGFASDLLSLGVAVSIDTDTSVLEPYIDSIDYVQFMGIARIGVQGQPFDTRVLEKIQAFHKAHPDLPIQVDGGVSLENAGSLLSVGASRLCVGSALLDAPDLTQRLQAFEAIAEEYGRYN